MWLAQSQKQLWPEEARPLACAAAIDLDVDGRGVAEHCCRRLLPLVLRVQAHLGCNSCEIEYGRIRSRLGGVQVRERWRR